MQELERLGRLMGFKVDRMIFLKERKCYIGTQASRKRNTEAKAVETCSSLNNLREIIKINRLNGE